MFSMNSTQTVPALVHSGSASTASTTPTVTGPLTPIGETKLISPPLPNKKSSKASLKTRLLKFGRSTKSLLRGTLFYKPVPPRPPFADNIWVVKERSIHADAAPNHQYNRAAAVSDTQIDMYIPMPCSPSQISLIPLHDGHILQSPAAEHHEEGINSHFPLATLTQIPHLPNLEPRHTLIPMTAAVGSPKMLKTVQVPHPFHIPPFSEHDRTSFLASRGLSCPRRGKQQPTRQSRLDFGNGSLSLRSITAVPQQSSSRSIVTPSSWLPNVSHFPNSLISRSSCWIFKYTGIMMTAGLGYYIYVSFFA